MEPEKENVETQETENLEDTAPGFDTVFGHPSDNEKDTENGQDEDSAVEDQEAEDQDDSEGSEGTEGNDENKEVSEVDVLKQELENRDKRLKDTQKSWNEQNQKHQKLLKILQENGTLTEDELKQFEVESSADQPLVEIGKRLDQEYKIAKPLLQRQGQNPDAAVEAFLAMVNLEPSLSQTLVTTPVEEQLAYVISEGEKILPVYQSIKENGNSVIAAMQALSKVTSKEDMEAAEKKGYEKARKEFEKELSQYSTGPKPKLRGSETSPSADKEAKEAKEKVGFEAIGL